MQLDRDWELAPSVEPLDSGALEGLRFLPAQVPGTVASALRSRGSWRMGDRARFDASEHWFRCRFFIRTHAARRGTDPADRRDRDDFRSMAQRH